jgi:hypothetical protein
MWSMAALAADAALDRPRALMMAAPRCCTSGMKVALVPAWSSIRLETLLPPTLAL